MERLESNGRYREVSEGISVRKRGQFPEVSRESRYATMVRQNPLDTGERGAEKPAWAWKPQALGGKFQRGRGFKEGTDVPH